MFIARLFGLIVIAAIIGCGGGGGVTSRGEVTVPASSLSSSSSLASSSSSVSPLGLTLKLEENYEGFCRFDGKVENTHSGYSASGYVNTENSVGASIQWKVGVAHAGVYTLSWTYAHLIGDLNATLTINGGNSTAVGFAPTGDLSTWIRSSVDVELSAGVNTLSLAAKTLGGLPNIDYLEVTGEGVVRVSCDGTVQPVMTPNALCTAGAEFEDVVIDCGGARVGTSCMGDSESQEAIFTLRNATIKNVVLSADGSADGIHCASGDCVLENVIWEDICEDAATNKSHGGTMTIIGGWAFNGNGGWGGKPDKIFQHNSLNNSTTEIIGGFTAKGVNGKLWRSCGNCTNNGGPRNLIINGARIEGSIGSVAGLNVNEGYADTVLIQNLAIENYTAGNPRVCDEYKGVQKGSNSTRIGEAWNNNNCMVDMSDITTF